MAGEPGGVIVTGGASGLGAAVVERLRRVGRRALVLDRQTRSNGDVHVQVDLADTAAAESATRRLAERHGPIDAVVTAAGTDACGTLAEVPREAWERVVMVNLLGTAAVVRGALPFLVEHGGRVITVASTLGLRAVSDATAYCASKFGVVGFTRALAAELAGRVGVTLLIPGGMQTAFFDGRPERYRPPADARLAPPADVAGVVVSLLDQPVECTLREVVVCPPTETSWP
jgi:NAD(P)-dependent dehydrogenase (short-subunit alcohol dehydrogenase family)